MDGVSELSYIVQTMGAKTVIRLYSGYIALIGFVGLYRTGSWVPVFISLGIAVITLGLLSLYVRKPGPGKPIMAVWLVICLGAFLASAFDMVGAHTHPQPGYRWIFLSEALWAVFALMVFLRNPSAGRA